MRTLKFRAWVIFPDGLVDPFMAYSDSMDMPYFWMVTDGCDIMQFTGLYDKNGKEIYEGDILELSAWSNVQIVQYDTEQAAFMMVQKGVEHYPNSLHYVNHAGINQTEVIGNIHENPELL